MVRALRIEYSGALYHITSRGNKQENIYLSDEDRILFLEIFSPQSHYMPVKYPLNEYAKKSSNRNECIRLAYATG